MDYTSIQALATRLITSYGTSITLQRASYTLFSPTQGSYTTNTTSSHTIKVVLRSPGRKWIGDRFFYDTQIESGDREIIIATQTTLTPDIGDHVLIGSERFRLISILPVTPGGTDLLYKALCRR
jgi:hypothetical protein